MDKASVVIGLMAGFIIGTILTGAAITFYAIEIVSSIPTGIVEIHNVNTTISFNETRLVEAMNNTGMLKQRQHGE